MGEEPIRILYVNGGLMNRGGIESFMMNYYRRFDRLLVQIDFVVHGYGVGAYDEEIKALGGNIYHVPIKSKHPFRYPRELKKIIKAGEYKIIHSHADAMSCWILKIAAECGVPVRIAHSHNTKHYTTNPVKYFINERARKNITKYATHCFACSEAAGKWLFGEHRFTVVPNAFELDKFAFDEKLRMQLRTQYRLSENDYVIGHVGRFAPQKNHAFLLDMFRAFSRENAAAKLVLIGDGELRKNIEDKIAAYELTDEVLLLGACDNVAELYNMMDVFVLPSEFEGLPVSALEAQANGMPCVCSEHVPSETAVTADSITFLPDDIGAWKQALHALQRKGRVDRLAALKAMGYDVEAESKKLQNFYLTAQTKK